MDKVNHSIKCSVQSCAYHANNKNFCTLNAIQVGGEAHPNDCQGTECSSFENK
jgi:hypothetical protein